MLRGRCPLFSEFSGRFARFVFSLYYNKAFIPVSLFLAYVFGVYAFKGGLEVGILFTSIILILYVLAIFIKKLKIVFSFSFLILLYFLFIFGFLNASAQFPKNDALLDIVYLKDVEITGTIEGNIKGNKNDDALKMLISADSIKYNGKTRKLLPESKVFCTMQNKNKEVKLKLKDKIFAKGTIKSPPSATNPYQFDYAEFLKNKGILKTFYSDKNGAVLVKSPSLSDIKEKDGIFARLFYLFSYSQRKLCALRDKAMEEHSKYISSPALEILGGIVFGDEAVNAPLDIKQSFIDSGLLHLLAASGLNVAIIFSFWMYLIYFFKIPYKIKVLSGIFIIFFYTVMTGFPPSVVRASVMLILFLSGKLAERKLENIPLIFTAGFLILIAKPNFLYDTGFQLSFFVTLGLVICIPCINSVIEEKQKLFLEKIKNSTKFKKFFLLLISPLSIACALSVPLIAQLWAAPLQAYYFNTFSLYAFFANIAVLPIIGLISSLGFISTIISFFNGGIILPPLDYILNFAINILLNISKLFSDFLPSPKLEIPSPSCLCMLLYYIFISLLFISLKQFKHKKKNIILSLTFLLITFIIYFIPYHSNKIEITFFDVKNADNILIKTKRNKYIMIDTGRYLKENLSSASAITLKYLLNKKIKKLDALIVTHFDSDHSGGLTDILSSIKVNKLIIPKPVCTSQNSCEIKKYIEENNIQYTEPKNGQIAYSEPDLTLTNFTPHTKNQKSKNDFSTISLLQIENNSINHKPIYLLFMADAGIKSYKSVEEFLPSDIFLLKSAHHGAKDTVNDEMLKKLNPEFSILLTGKNGYGHPDKKTCELLEKYSTVLSTKELGMIQLVINDNSPPHILTGKNQKPVKF